MTLINATKEINVANVTNFTNETSMTSVLYLHSALQLALDTQLPHGWWDSVIHKEGFLTNM